jgi:hypothetical protein
MCPAHPGTHRRDGDREGESLVLQPGGDSTSEPQDWAWLEMAAIRTESRDGGVCVVHWTPKAKEWWERTSRA